MKNFFTSLLGALVALVVFFGGCLLLAGLVLAVLIAVGQKQPVSLERGSYLVFDLSTRIQDAPVDFDGGALFGPLLGGGRVTTLQLRTVTRALRSAANDPRIAGLLITSRESPVDGGVGFGQLKELRTAIEDFKHSGKPVIAYLNDATTRDYYVASAASDVVLDPYGMILLPGLSSRPLFMAGAFDKFGVGVQVTRVGKYKSAVEPFTRKDLSPAAREDLQKLLGDIWTNLESDIARSRGLQPAEVQEAVDDHGLFMASDALAAKLVDRTAYRDQVIDELKARTGVRVGGAGTFKQIGLPAYARLMAENAPAGGAGRVAVVYAEGDIVDGEGQAGDVGGRKFSRELRRLRQDPEVKAIVLRVNSPGGSATASEEIQREMRLTMKVKPVVVSMGSVAASGGYWISAYADRIFAEPTTITGSIGVFGLFINVQQLANNLGFTWDTVQTGKLSGLLTISRPKTDEELAVFQHMVDWIYDQFTDKVAAARKLDKAKVLDIAQGRVWSGVEAKQIGLVDEIGGLRSAILYAAKKAGLGPRFRLVEYPRPRELKDVINEIVQGATPGDTFGNGALKQMLGEFKSQLKVLSQFNDPHGIYARLPVDLRVQ
jgi:protease IV